MHGFTHFIDAWSDDEQTAQALITWPLLRDQYIIPHMSWRKGKDAYNQLIQSIVQRCNQAGDFCNNEEQVVGYAKYQVTEFVERLTVKNLTLVHVYLVHMSELKPDPLFPAYVYTGGDRIISVTRYLIKYIELELAKQYA